MRMRYNEKAMNQQRIYHIYIIICFFFVVISLLVYTFSFLFEDDFVVEQYEEERYYQITDEVVADAVVIYNVKNDRIIAGKNADSLKSIASITKLIAALVAYPRINEQDVSTLQTDDFEAFANTPLRLGDRWQTDQLLSYSLITSSNRGIRAISRTVEEKTGLSIVEHMNRFVRENALLQTHFINPTGLDAHAKLAGSESSARDIAKLAGIIVTTQHDLAEQTVREQGTFYSLNGIQYTAENTNKLLNVVPEIVLLSKTGYTDIAGGSLVMVVERRGDPIVFVVLDSTRTGRFKDMERLLSLDKEIAATGRVY